MTEDDSRLSATGVGINSSKADADDATLIERVELAAAYPAAFPKGMSGITRRRARYTIRSVTIQ